jgi:hypothetical protein
VYSTPNGVHLYTLYTIATNVLIWNISFSMAIVGWRTGRIRYFYEDYSFLKVALCSLVNSYWHFGRPAAFVEKLVPLYQMHDVTSQKTIIASHRRKNLKSQRHFSLLQRMHTGYVAFRGHQGSSSRRQSWPFTSISSQVIERLWLCLHNFFSISALNSFCWFEVILHSVFSRPH